MDITTRAEAIAAGLDRYFTGKQCANGHLSPRYVSQHGCVDCRAERDKKYRTENIRITGRLIDAVTGAHIWADRFERELTDVFALQDEVTAAVVSAIQPKLLQTEIATAARRRPENLTAYDLYLRARWRSERTRSYEPLLSNLSNMPALTRRRDRDLPQECWRVYYGDVHAGTIAQCVGNPGAASKWQWRCGFYPGSRPGECTNGTTATFQAAREGFEAAWRVFLSNRSEADFQAWRDQQAWTAEKYLRFAKGERMSVDWQFAP